MKGMVFTEFLEMVEQKFGFEVADEIIEKADLPSGGTYTAVGAYDHSEMVNLVVALSENQGIEVPALLEAFGEYLFGRFVSGYPAFFERANDAFEFLESIHEYIHVEVKKLYPDAELPSFDTKREGSNTLIMDYQSRRHFEDLAVGLMKGCLAHFRENAEISRTELDADRTRFTLVRSVD